MDHFNLPWVQQQTKRLPARYNSKTVLEVELTTRWLENTFTFELELDVAQT